MTRHSPIFITFSLLYSLHSDLPESDFIAVLLKQLIQQTRYKRSPGCRQVTRTTNVYTKRQHPTNGVLINIILCYQQMKPQLFNFEQSDCPTLLVCRWWVLSTSDTVQAYAFIKGKWQGGEMKTQINHNISITSGVLWQLNNMAKCGRVSRYKMSIDNPIQNVPQKSSQDSNQSQFFLTFSLETFGKTLHFISTYLTCTFIMPKQPTQNT